MISETLALVECAGQTPEQLRARAAFYRLLAGAFLEEPAADYLAALREPEVIADLATFGVHFDADFTDADLSELKETLACEYTTLFASPGGCPPVESARLTGRLQQEPFHAVQSTYRRCGFEIENGRFALFEDQLGVELSFVAALLDRQALAAESSDAAAGKGLDKEIKRFWALHLGLWVRGYASLLERVTVHSFYREIAGLLRVFAVEELALLAVRVDDVDGGRESVPKSEISLEFNPNDPVCGACGDLAGKAVA